LNKNDFKCRLKALVYEDVVGVPCRWSRVAEATLAELSSCSALKVVCCIRRSQVSGTTSVDELYTVNQVLRCSA